MMTMLTKNWVAKLGSFLSALMLFWYVQANRTITRDIQVRVEPMKLPGDLVYASKYPAYINVQLRGPRELMDFPVSDLKVRLFSEKPRPGARITFQTLLPNRLPAGVEANYIKRVFLEVDREMQRELPVDPLYSVGKLKNGLRAGYARIEPATLRIKGPARLVQGLTKIQTREVEVRMDRPGVFEAYAYPSGLPDFTELAPDQPFELRFRMLVLPPDSVPVEPGQVAVPVEGIRARCSNGLSAYDLELDPINAVVSMPEGRPAPKATQLEALFYCPVDPKTGEPLPLNGVPVRVEDRFGRNYLSVQLVSPAKTSVRFKRTARSLTQDARSSFAKPKDK